jgi:hypothetical protein
LNIKSGHSVYLSRNELKNQQFLVNYRKRFRIFLFTNSEDMTKEEFLKIVDSGNSKDYSNNAEFISIDKQVSEEYRQQRENQF